MLWRAAPPRGRQTGRAPLCLARPCPAGRGDSWRIAAQFPHWAARVPHVCRRGTGSTPRLVLVSLCGEAAGGENAPLSPFDFGEPRMKDFIGTAAKPREKPHTDESEAA
eukprot:8363778-Pyramimonas_sp.AAC.1